MKIQTKRYIIISAVLIIVVLAVAYGFIPKPVAVDAVPAARGVLRVTVEEQGKTSVKDRYVISAPVSGFLRRIDLKASDPVEPGMQVAFIEPARSQALDPRSRAETESAVASAQANLDAAREQERAARAEADYTSKRLARFKVLHERQSVSRDSLDQADSEARRAQAVLDSASAQVGVARAELERIMKVLNTYGRGGPGPSNDTVAVTSPVSGRTLRVVRESEGAVAVGEALMEVGNPADLEVRVEVLSSDAVKMGKGTPVLFERWGGDVPLTGIVRVVEPGGFTKISSLGVEEQRVIVRVDFTTPREVWQSLGDAYRLDASFIVWEGRNVLQVPASSAFRSGTGWAVFVVEDKKARLRSVKVGHSNGLSTEILSGLSEGERVITHPDDTIRDGTRVQLNGV